MKRSLAILLLFLLILQVGCGTKDTQIQTLPENTAFPEETAAPGPAIVSGPDLNDGVFTLLYTSDDTLNPYSCRTERSRELCSLLFEPLISITPEFQTEAALCTAWDTRDGGCSYTLTLRPDARFSDGSEIRCWDVMYSLNRARESGFYASRLACVADITQSDGKVVITLDTQNPSFPLRLDIPVVKEGSGYSDVPVGSGMYLYQATAARVWLCRNAFYPDFDLLPCEEIGLLDCKNEAALGEFQQGNVDLLTELPGERRQSMGNIVRHSFPTTVLTCLLVDTKSQPLSEPARRRLVNAALNRDAIAELLNGDATLLPLHPLLSEYDAAATEQWSIRDWSAYCMEIFTEDYDGDGALEYIQDGVPVDFSLKIAVCSDKEYSTSVGHSLEDSLRSRGIGVTLSLLNEADFHSAMESHSCDLYLVNIRLTSDFDLTGLFDYCCDTILQEMAATFRSTGGRVRKKAAVALCSRCAESCAVIPLAFGRGSIDTRTGAVSGAEPSYSDVFRNFSAWELREMRTEQDKEEKS